ncbi:hypothetical protein SDC9_194154 [bioreactor metagenome]|uniref:Uncharacterized protein n=1 Tax=bioreactor metagenome TaxID=1076179 RepID=A0A645IE48_9ZZZZ
MDIRETIERIRNGEKVEFESKGWEEAVKTEMFAQDTADKIINLVRKEIGETNRTFSEYLASKILTEADSRISRAAKKAPLDSMFDNEKQKFLREKNDRFDEACKIVEFKKEAELKEQVSEQPKYSLINELIDRVNNGKGISKAQYHVSKIMELLECILQDEH